MLGCFSQTKIKSITVLQIINTIKVTHNIIETLNIMNFDLSQDVRKPYESFKLKFHEACVKAISNQ